MRKQSMLVAIEKYMHHQSIISILQKMKEKGQVKLSFQFATLIGTMRQIALLSTDKTSESSDISI